jgi:hypothetical protein
MNAQPTVITPDSAPWRRLDDDARQLLAVLVTAIAAVLLGWLLVAFTTGGTRTAQAGGLEVQIPDGWVVRPGIGEVVLVASDPRSPGVRLSVSRTTDAADRPATVLDRRLSARAALLTGFSVLDRTAGTSGSRATETATFTWAATPDGAPVEGMEGREEAVSASGGTIVTTLESPTDGYADALPAFEAFSASIKEVGS